MAPHDRPRPLAPLARKIAVVAWVGLWIAVAGVTFVRVRELRSLTTTLEHSASALDTAGSGLEALKDVPLIGEGPARLGREVRATATEARASASGARSAIESLSVLFAIVVLGATITPAVIAYRSATMLRRELEQLRQMHAATAVSATSDPDSTDAPSRDADADDQW